jgi:hypothetical protein
MPDSNYSASCPVRIRKADLTAISGAIQSDVVREPKTWERGHLAIETPEGETPSLPESHITLNRTRQSQELGVEISEP